VEGLAQGPARGKAGSGPLSQMLMVLLMMCAL